tara:strand:- start:198 stop:308 length:111 start_codon:yes stop_codon:yes gene_type:complete
MKTARSNIKCVAIVKPNTNQEPKYSEKAVHHIHDNI